MRQGFRRPSPALVVSLIALFVALSGTVYAAAKIDGRVIKAKSLPGNRLKVGSVPGNRLRPGALSGNNLAPGSVTGVQVDVSTLGQVPSALNAVSAESADNAQTAVNAQHADDAISAVSAVDAQHADNATTVNGHTVQCAADTMPFLGGCWQTAVNQSALTAPAAAADCASQGGALPESLQLAAFSQKPGITLDAGDEWSSDLTTFSGPDVYGVVTVSATAVVSFAPVSNTKKYRCVFPLVT